MEAFEKVYKDSSRTPSERAKALLKLMTVEEKVGQLNQRLYGFNIYRRNDNGFELTDEFKEEVARFGGLGVLYGLYRADPWADKDETTGITPELACEAYNTVQKYVVEHSRFGIPMLVSTECPHGHQALDGGLLPVNTAVGATFDPELTERAYAACGEQLLDNRVDMALMSVLDVCRDPRWGRTEECYSEDPYLSAQMAYHAVKGMQSAGVISVAKHLCAQGETTGGINASAARIGERELREIHLPPVKAISEAGAGGVMAAYNEIDGVYCHANRWLLRDVLREEFGFKGVVMADGCAIDSLNTVTGDCVRSGAMALKAGVGISLWDRAFSTLKEALEKGYITEELLDEAVERVLTIKFERGLFEKPYMEKNPLRLAGYKINGESLNIARESVILLKNDNVLPLKKVKKILVTGPDANDRYRQLGDYTPPVDPANAVTVLEGIKRVAKDAEVIFTPGSGLFETTDEELERVAQLAKECDVCIAAFGGSSSRFENVNFDINGAAISEGKITMDCGEGRDVSDIRLPQAQNRLADVLEKSGKPVVSIIISGRPYGIGQVLSKSNACLQSFYPGPMGGLGIAEILFGEVNPSGRLPVSIPASSGNIPAYYNTTDSYKAQNYSVEEAGILYGFGHGLSYTEFKISNAALSCDERVKGLGRHTLTFDIANTGATEGVAVPMLFLHHRMTQAVQRRRELKWFTRVSLKQGEEKRVSVVIPESAFETMTMSCKYEYEPGESDWYLAEGGKDIAEGRILR